MTVQFSRAQIGGITTKLPQIFQVTSIKHLTRKNPTSFPGPLFPAPPTFKGKAPGTRLVKIYQDKFNKLNSDGLVKIKFWLTYLSSEAIYKNAFFGHFLDMCWLQNSRFFCERSGASAKTARDNGERDVFSLASHAWGSPASHARIAPSENLRKRLFCSLGVNLHFLAKGLE